MTVPSPRGDRDRGAATLLAAVLVSALALAAAAGAAVGSVALRRSQVQAVADVAALAYPRISADVQRYMTSGRGPTRIQVKCCI